MQLDDLAFHPWPDHEVRKFRRDGYWIDRPLTDILWGKLAVQPDKIALITCNGKFSYLDLAEQADSFAAYLKQKGVQRGSHALVQLPNDETFYITFWALLRLGVKAVYALFNHNHYELQSFYKTLDPDLLILSRKHKLFSSESDKKAKLIQDAITQGKVLHFTHTETEGSETIFGSLGIKYLEEKFLAESLDPSDVAFFQLSGGSTNVPKLIPRTHNDYEYSIRRSAEICEFSTETTYLCALPAAHNFPLSSPGALGVWHKGGCVVLAPDPSIETCFPLIKSYSINWTALVPSIVKLWIERGCHRKAEISSLQILQVGGAPFSEALASLVQPKLGPKVQQVYGMAEGLVCYTGLDDPLEKVYGTQGKPMCPADEIKVTRLNGSDHTDAADNEGLLWTKGPYTFRGYYRDDQHNRLVFDFEGFYCTGDIVRVDPDGYLKVIGRAKDQINRGGEKIASAEIEALLTTHDEVIDAALVAMPDPGLGEKSLAFIVCKNGMPKPHLIRSFLRNKGIADYKIPDRFIQVPEIPLTPVGKPDKNTLKSKFGISLKFHTEKDQLL